MLNDHCDKSYSQNKFEWLIDDDFMKWHESSPVWANLGRSQTKKRVWQHLQSSLYFINQLVKFQTSLLVASAFVSFIYWQDLYLFCLALSICFIHETIFYFLWQKYRRKLNLLNCVCKFIKLALWLTYTDKRVL